jgi:ribonuclease P protein component
MGGAVLTRENRLTSSQRFSRTARHGRRAGTRTVVVHLEIEVGLTQPQVGLVVSKAVGPAVKRNVVKRRLRHLARERISSLPGSAVLVVRALPGAGGASYAELAEDLDRALRRVLRDRLGRGSVTA